MNVCALTENTVIIKVTFSKTDQSLQHGTVSNR